MVFFENALSLVIAGFAVYEVVWSNPDGNMTVTFAISSLTVAIVLLILDTCVLAYSTCCLIPLLALVMPLR